MLDDPTIINLSAKLSKSQLKFNNLMREQRGNRCELCGATADREKIEAHHVLNRRYFPKYVKTPANILVVCQPCHSLLIGYTGNMSKEALEPYRFLPVEIRFQIAIFVRMNEPKLTTLIDTLECGGGNMEWASFKRMKLDSPKTPPPPTLPKDPMSPKSLKKLRKRLKAAAQKQRNLDAWKRPGQEARGKHTGNLKGLYK
jgi:hypothetical protein